MTTAKHSEPSHVLTDIVRQAGETPRLMWEIRGPKDTGVAWLSCYAIGSGVVIVETYKNGNGWNAFTPNNSIKIEDTVLDVFNRCGVPVPVAKKS